MTMRNHRVDKLPAGAISGELEALRLKNAELEKRNRRLCVYIEQLAHDLKTPLTPLLGASEMLASAVTDKPWTDFARSIQMSAESLLRIVDELLDLEKCDRGLLELNCADIDAAALLSETTDGHRDDAATGHLIYGVEISQLPPVRADGHRLRQVTDTLLTNAIKNTPDGGRVVLTAVVKNGWLQVSVIDTGMSIDEDELRDIFQEYPVPGLKKSRAGSNGLALAKRLIGLHGGEISASRGADANNIFTFGIPVAGVKPIELGAI
jgi:signal transduction histidine kinase